MPVFAPSAFDYPLLRQQLGNERTRFDLTWMAECDSTNARLLQQATLGIPSGTVLVADRQTAGRGRRGRQWIAPPEGCLMFSVYWRLPPGSDGSGLSLAVGLAVAQALESLGVADVGLKWPNDIWLRGGKLGGVLTEVGTSHNGLGLVIGIGLNLRGNPDWLAQLGRSGATLADAGIQLPREIVLGTILQRLAQTLDRFCAAGFTVLREAWCARNALRGQPVRICGEGTEYRGICGDVATDGALILLQDEGVPLRITSGDVSLLPLPVK